MTRAVANAARAVAARSCGSCIVAMCSLVGWLGLGIE